jgi:hypothetical protein
VFYYVSLLSVAYSAGLFQRGSHCLVPVFSDSFTVICGGADKSDSCCESGLHRGPFRKSFSFGHLAQWLTAALSGCGIGSIGILLRLGVVHHSMGARQPLQRL